MNVEQAYKNWSGQYDTNSNKTRDLEAVSLKEMINTTYENCLEIGCGTGKNTQWLVTKCNNILSVDLTKEMLAIAKAKVPDAKVTFQRADINQHWDFAGNKTFDLVVCSLVLEHIENIDRIIGLIAERLNTNGALYISELHPFKQYAGSKARYEDENGLHIVTCFTHHISEFTNAAINHGLTIETIKEYFDDNDTSSVPRILTLLFRKP
ncbi:class I SAM-dependent DNA methyltransferase [Polluticaenibacter yanchengensis]|uniref:Class I SAM-dependent methyltransferase n=1 Tax=Polluticaenibacter yanchengensis TaxID=3014562 RepID=A0ABT4UJ45_9BACT|nr:class I SAM-dependent methyltransferase [Chitinophagaceae bacterium LY-5]